MSIAEVHVWLEEKLAQYPDITRYFSGADEEVVRLLGEIARIRHSVPICASTLPAECRDWRLLEGGKQVKYCGRDGLHRFY
jgi:hypothetical protein